MERTNNPEAGKKQFKKTGGGSLRYGNRIKKPGQTFWAYPEDIPEVFRDTVIPVGQGSEQQEEPLKVSTTEYSLSPRPTGGWFDVLDGNGKKVNEKALKRVDALKLIDMLKA